MNAASKPSGLEVGSTRPLSRAERRAQAARVQPEETPAAPAVEAGTSPHPDDKTPPLPALAAPTPDQDQESAVRLKPRQRKAKNPFATQLHSGTLARLEWIKARGYVITDTVDDAINTYLDGAGIPRPDHNDRMP
jgi:hypothetical protein